jgi:hypothetical protein
MLQSTGGLTSKCYSQPGDELLNLAFLLQSDEANQSQCCNALQSTTVAQFDRNFRAMLFEIDRDLYCARRSKRAWSCEIRAWPGRTDGGSFRSHVTCPN